MGTGLPTKEFQSSQLHKWANEEGVQIYKTTAHTPWMNGKSERAGAIIMERSRALTIDLNIPPHLWSFVVQSVVTVMNLMPSKANPEGKSPHELLWRAIPGYPKDEIKPLIKHLRTYFCTAYYYLNTQRPCQIQKAKAHMSYSAEPFLVTPRTRLSHGSSTYAPPRPRQMNQLSQSRHKESNPLRNPDRKSVVRERV